MNMNEPIPIDEIWDIIEQDNDNTSDYIVGQLNELILDAANKGETQVVLKYQLDPPYINQQEVSYAIAARKFYNMSRAYEVQFHPIKDVPGVGDSIVKCEGMIIVRWL